MSVTFLEERDKASFKIIRHGWLYCRRCKRLCRGKSLKLVTDAEPSIDGSIAFRIFKCCDEKGHLSEVGWDRMIDFDKVKIKADAINKMNEGQSVEDADAELEEILGWKEKKLFKRFDTPLYAED